jgi:hypothetical protein
MLAEQREDKGIDCAIPNKSRQQDATRSGRREQEPGKPDGVQTVARAQPEQQAVAGFVR